MINKLKTGFELVFSQPVFVIISLVCSSGLPRSAISPFRGFGHRFMREQGFDYSAMREAAAKHQNSSDDPDNCAFLHLLLLLGDIPAES